MSTRRIMVPLDGSAFSESALPWAFAIGDAWDADVEIVNVHEPLPVPEFGPIDEDVVDEWSQSYLARTALRIADATGRQVTTTVLHGAPVEALQKHEADSGADLVVMATHGRGPLSRLWLGSVADAYVRRARVPVLLTRPDDDEQPNLAATPSLDRVLVPLDGSDAAESVLAVARDACDSFGVTYDLLRVFPYPDEFASAYLPQTVSANAQALEEGKQVARAYVERMATALHADGAQAESDVVVDHSPAAGILHHAGEKNVDLIAMATHGHGGVTRALLGSVTDKVVRGAAVPVLVVRPER